jgi:hypothetical protein
MACVGRTLLSDAFDLMRISVGGAILENPERHSPETAQQTLFSSFRERKRAQSAVSHRSVINILRPRALPARTSEDTALRIRRGP